MAMQEEYLAKLSAYVVGVVHEVEQGSGVEIRVQKHAALNGQGALGLGKLRVVIEPPDVTIEAPTNGYFPDSGVFHEVLHIHRMLVEGVPRIVLSEDDADFGFERALLKLDEALEHLVIVPKELARYPDRLKHWSAAMQRTLSQVLPELPEAEQRIWAQAHWPLVREALGGTAAMAAAEEVLQKLGAQQDANEFADALIALIGDKEQVVKMCFEWFGLPKCRAALEYQKTAPGQQQPIP